MAECVELKSGEGFILKSGKAQPAWSPACFEVKTYTVQKPMMGMTASLSADDKEKAASVCTCIPDAADGVDAVSGQDSVHYIYVCVKGEA